MLVPHPERIQYIDYAKAVGILLIMLAHCVQFFPVLHWLNYAACSFHVPIFFIVSGFIVALFPEKYDMSFSTFIKKRFRALILPYIYFSLFNSLLKLSILCVTHKLTSSLFLDEMTELLVTGNGTVWFLATLFLSELIFFIIKRRIWNISAMIIACFVCFFIGSSNNPFLIVFLRFLCAYFLIVVGYYICVFLLKFASNRKSTKCIAFSGGGLLIIWMIILILSNYHYSFFSATFETPVISILVMLTASIGTIFVLSTIKKRIFWLEYIGKNSLLLMLIHPTILLFFIYLFAGKAKAWNNTIQVIVAFALFVFIILACIPLINLINRKFYFLIGKKQPLC